MKILTIKRLPQTQEEMDLLKDMFGDGLIYNLFDEGSKEPLGLREATDLEIKFLSELKTILENQNSNYGL
jgi:hypothetical protein